MVLYLTASIDPCERRHGRRLHVRYTQRSTGCSSFLHDFHFSSNSSILYSIGCSQILAPSSYYSINWDLIGSFETMKDHVNAMLALKNESITTGIVPYGGSGVMTNEEHNATHSALPNSEVSFPHSVLFTPVHQIPGDSDSKVVAFISGGFAWDFALRYVLPDNIEGIVVEIRNSCNQSGTYELMGHNAIFLGEHFSHDPKFDNMEVVRDLSPSTHPNFATIPGHCRYTMVRIQVLL
jgi:hypothetical protein